MYTPEQRQDHVRELQYYLRALSANDERYPRIGLDGLFGPETEQAVRVLQEISGAPITGTVQRADWERLVTAYDRSIRQSSPTMLIAPFPSPDFVLTPASHEPIVTILQVMLNDIMRAPIAVTGVYDEPTIQSVRLLQIAGELPLTGLVDNVTWDLLATLYNSR